MSRRTGWLLVCLLVCLPGLGAGPPEEAGFSGSEAHGSLRRSGHEVVAERELDLDADGRLDAIVVARGPDGLELRAYRAGAERRFELLSRSTVLPAEELVALEPFALGARQGLRLEAVEDSPDEAEHHLRLFAINAAGLAEVLATRWSRSHSEEDAGRTPVELVDLGGALLVGLSVGQASTPDAWPTIVQCYEPKTLTFSPAGRRPVQVRIGCRTRVFGARDGRYQVVDEGFADALWPLGLAAVEAGPATSSHAAQAVDQNLQTGWRPTGPGEALRLLLPASLPIRGLRLVPVCRPSGSPPAEVRRLRIRFDPGPTFELDRDRPDRLPEGVLGFGDFKLGDGGVQTLVLLRTPVVSQAVELSVAAAGAAEPPACLAEVSLLGARVDLEPPPVTSSSATAP